MDRSSVAVRHRLKQFRIRKRPRNFLGVSFQEKLKQSKLENRSGEGKTLLIEWPNTSLEHPTSHASSVATAGLSDAMVFSSQHSVGEVLEPDTERCSTQLSNSTCMNKLFSVLSCTRFWYCTHRWKCFLYYIRAWGAWPNGCWTHTVPYKLLIVSTGGTSERRRK